MVAAGDPPVQVISRRIRWASDQFCVLLGHCV